MEKQTRVGRPNVEDKKKPHSVSLLDGVKVFLVGKYGSLTNALNLLYDLDKNNLKKDAK